MLSIAGKPDIRNIVIAGILILIVSVLGGLIANEPLVYLAPVAFLLAFQLVMNYRAVFYLLLISTPVSIEYSFDNGFSTNLPTEPLMILLMFTFIFRVLMDRRSIDPKLIRHPITFVLIIHFVWMIVATVFSSDMTVSLKFMLAKTWYIITFYFVASQIIRNAEDYKKAFWCLFVPALLMVIYTLNNHMHYQFRFSEVNKTMVPFFRNHVNYAVFLALFFPFLFPAAKWYRKYSWQKMLINFGKLMFLLGIYFSYTRSAWVSVAVAFVAFLVIRKNLLPYGVALAIAGVIGFIAYMYTNNNFMRYAPDFSKTIYHTDFSEHMESTLTLEDVSSAERIYRWVAAVNMIKHKPVTGFGPESFYDNYKNYTVNKFITYISRNEEHSTVHNYYLEVTAEQGFPGLVIWISLLVLTLITGQRVYKHAEDPHDKAYVMALLISLITILVNISLSDLIEADKIGTLFFMDIAGIVTMDIHLRRKRAALQISGQSAP